MKSKNVALTSDAKPEGRYVNYFKVGHNADVFVIDYFQLFLEGLKDTEECEIRDTPKFRMITSPSDAKQFYRHLKASIQEYEQKYGSITKE